MCTKSQTYESEEHSFRVNKLLFALTELVDLIFHWLLGLSLIITSLLVIFLTEMVFNLFHLNVSHLRSILTFWKQDWTDMKCHRSDL